MKENNKISDIKLVNKKRTVSGKVTTKKAQLDTSSIRLISNKAASVKNLIEVNNPQVTKAHSMRVGTSETIRSLLKEEWLDWLAGLIDGDGYFALSKKGYAALEITMDMKDARCLYEVKQKLGGSVKRRSGVKAVRYRLHDFKGLNLLIAGINGKIRNPVRQIQLSKICYKYKVEFKFPLLLEKASGWMSGFFDSDGTITIKQSTKQLSISIFQKTSELLKPLSELYGGYIYIDRSLNGGFKWYITDRKTILELLEYFKKYPSRAPFKASRLHLVPEFYYIKDLKLDNTEKEKLWSVFYNKWLTQADEEFEPDFFNKDIVQ